MDIYQAPVFKPPLHRLCTSQNHPLGVNRPQKIIIPALVFALRVESGCTQMISAAPGRFGRPAL